MMNFLRTIVGVGLQDKQKQALREFITARRKIPKNQRAAEFTAAEQTEARRSKPFAFWLVACQIAIDRPIFFWIGSAALAITLTRVILNFIASLFA